MAVVRYKYTTDEYYNHTHNVLEFLPMELAHLCLEMAGNPELWMTIDRGSNVITAHTPLHFRNVKRVDYYPYVSERLNHFHIYNFDENDHKLPLSRLKHLEKFIKHFRSKHCPTYLYEPLLNHRTYIEKTEEVKNQHSYTTEITTQNPGAPYYEMEVECSGSCQYLNPRVVITCDLTLRFTKLKFTRRRVSIEISVHAISTVLEDLPKATTQ